MAGPFIPFHSILGGRQVKQHALLFTLGGGRAQRGGPHSRPPLLVLAVGTAKSRSLQYLWGWREQFLCSLCVSALLVSQSVEAQVVDGSSLPKSLTFHCAIRGRLVSLEDGTL